jgi:DNA-binding helix-hairpin-helix protein with protein kinase domain
VGRLWIAALGEEALYEVDLPGCCRRSARSFDDSFECPACGAAWQAPLPIESEECAFTERASDGERKGAA